MSSRTARQPVWHHQRRRRRARSSRSPRPRPRRMADSQRAKSRALCRSPRSTSVGRSMSRAVSSWNCSPTRRATRPSSFCASAGAQQLLQGRQHGAQVFERVGAEGALAPFLGPVRGLELGLVGPVDARHLLRAVGEAHALVFLERPAVVEIVAFEARHAVDRHAGADEAQARDCRATRRCGRASRAASPPTPHAARRRSPCRARSSAAADSAPRPSCRSRAGSPSSRRPAHWNDSDRARRPARRARPARPSFCRPGRNFSRCWRRKWRKTYSRAVSSPRRVTSPRIRAVISAL